MVIISCGHIIHCKVHNLIGRIGALWNSNSATNHLIGWSLMVLVSNFYLIWYLTTIKHSNTISMQRTSCWMMCGKIQQQPWSFTRRNVQYTVPIQNWGMCRIVQRNAFPESQEDNRWSLCSKMNEIVHERANADKHDNTTYMYL